MKSISSRRCFRLSSTPLGLTNRVRRSAVPIRASSSERQPDTSPEQPPEQETNPTVHADPKQTPIMEALDSDDKHLNSTRILFGSIFAITLFIWSTARFFFSAPSPNAGSSHAQGTSTSTSIIAADKLKLRERRRIKPESGTSAKPATESAASPIKKAASAQEAPDASPEKTSPSIPGPPNTETLPRPELSRPPLGSLSHDPTASSSTLTAQSTAAERDLPILREKASSALRAAASAADASQKANSHATSSVSAAKKASEAAQRASLAASEAQLALEEAAEEAVTAAELRARQAAALASDLEHQALRSNAAASAFDDLAQLQASIATENAALASSLQRKISDPQSSPPPPSQSNLDMSSSLKQQRLAKGFGFSVGGSWLKEVGEGAKESIEGAWKRVYPGSSLISSSFKKENGSGSASALSLPSSPPPHALVPASGKQQVPSGQIVPINDGPRFPPSS